MSGDFKAVAVVGRGPEALDQLVRMLVNNMHRKGVARVGQRDATERDPLDMAADIAEHGDVKVFQLGAGPELPAMLDADATAAFAVSWLAKLTRDDYPKGKGYHDSYSEGWLLMSGWRDCIELVPAWIGVSK